MNSASGISAQSLRRLIRRARESVQLPEDGPDGWTQVSDVNPIVGAFDRLRLKAGYVLRAYAFREGGNGNAFVYAMPANAPLPDPDDCELDRSHFLQPPVPKQALPDVMAAIEGDGSPLSFAQASILARELREFGACWHGCKWSTHTIIDKDPKQKRIRVAYSKTIAAAAWSWDENVLDWEPRIEIGPSTVFVFYTHSALDQERIVRHTDVYAPSTYQFETEQRVVATGPLGFVF